MPQGTEIFSSVHVHIWQKMWNFACRGILTCWVKKLSDPRGSTNGLAAILNSYMAAMMKHWWLLSWVLNAVRHWNFQFCACSHLAESVKFSYRGILTCWGEKIAGSQMADQCISRHLEFQYGHHDEKVNITILGSKWPVALKFGKQGYFDMLSSTVD